MFTLVRKQKSQAKHAPLLTTGTPSLVTRDRMFRGKMVSWQERERRWRQEPSGSPASPTHQLCDLRKVTDLSTVSNIVGLGGFVSSVKLRNTLLQEVLFLDYRQRLCGLYLPKGTKPVHPKLEFKFGYICLTDTGGVKSNNLFPCVFWYKNGIQWPPWPMSRGFQWGSDVMLSVKPPWKLSWLLRPPCWRASPLCFCDVWSDPHCVRPHATVCSPIPLLPPPKPFGK